VRRRVAFLVVVAFCVPACAEDGAEALRFRLTMTGRAELELDGKRHKIGSETVINYRHLRQGHDISVVCDSVAVKNTSDGAVSYEGYMDRAKTIFTGQNGKKQELTTDQDPALKKTLEASFGTILAKLELDDDGGVLKQKVNNDPAAKDFVASGMVTNCLLFHAPYPAGKEKWARKIEYSMLGGGTATGELTYEKQPERGTKQRLTWRTRRQRAPAERESERHAESADAARFLRPDHGAQRRDGNRRPANLRHRHERMDFRNAHRDGGLLHAGRRPRRDGGEIGDRDQT